MAKPENSELKRIEESNNREWTDRMDEKTQRELDEFKNYYNVATPDVRQRLDAQYKQYFNEELQKDSELKNALVDSEKKESAEISPEDINNLNTVRNLTDVLNTYPAISDPEYRAVKRMVDEYTQNLTNETEKVLSNKEKVEGENIEQYN